MREVSKKLYRKMETVNSHSEFRKKEEKRSEQRDGE